MLGTMTVPDKLAMFFIGNVFAHTGEISAIKGVQGAKRVSVLAMRPRYPHGSTRR